MMTGLSLELQDGETIALTDLSRRLWPDTTGRRAEPSEAGRIVVRMKRTDTPDQDATPDDDDADGPMVLANPTGVRITAHLPKDTTPAMLQEAILYLAGAFRFFATGINVAETNADDHAPLTVRERQVLIAVHQGLSNKMIARRLCIAEATVKAHVKSIMRKTGSSNRTQAAVSLPLLTDPANR